jgi:hypothetical protein
MTREEAKVFLPILQAYADGKTIQYHAIEDGYWSDVTESDVIDPMAFAYRIKPEVKYRPFKDADECWNEMEKHKPFGWLKSKESEERINIAILFSNGITIDDYLSYEEAMQVLNFADGTPFGIMEGGEV